MGSEMCIRDSDDDIGHGVSPQTGVVRNQGDVAAASASGSRDAMRCLLYTSDAADERSSVDLGGRRIIKKKTRRGCRRAAEH